MSETEGMNNSLSVGNLIDVLKEFPQETPVFFVSTTPDNQFEVSCEYFNDFIEVDEGKVATVLKNGTANLLDNDFKLTTNLTPIIVTNPINGTLTFNSNGTFSYVHNGSETLSDSFTYKITEGATESN